MNELLKKARKADGQGYVTLTMNTHVTQPEKEADPVMLKKLVREAESRLYDIFDDKRLVWSVMENLTRVADSITWENNEKSLVIFANSRFGDYTRLPIVVTDRVTVEDSFVTRDIVRAMQQEFSYYILLLNRNEARLLEAFNGTIVRELGNEFPMQNPLYTTDKLKQSMKEGSDNYINEFFNQVDKAVWDEVRDARKPVILATEARNFNYYTYNTDHPDMILGYVPLNGDGQPLHKIVDNTWRKAKYMLREGNAARIAELREAGDKLVEGLTEIWNAISEGRAATLFVRRDYHQQARIASNPDTGDFEILPTGEGYLNEKGTADDIVDEMIERTLDSGGEVVFIDGDQLETFGNVALVARYAYAEAEA